MTSTLKKKIRKNSLFIFQTLRKLDTSMRKLVRCDKTIFFDQFLMFWFNWFYVFGKAGTFLGSRTYWLQMSILAKNQSSISWRKRLPACDRFLILSPICPNLVSPDHQQIKTFWKLVSFSRSPLDSGYQKRKFKNIHLDILLQKFRWT